MAEEIVTVFGTFTEDQFGQIVDSGVAAANPWGVPSPDALGSVGKSSDIDWSSVVNTGLKTAGDIVTTVAGGKGGGSVQPSARTPKPGPAPIPQVNVTLAGGGAPMVSQPSSSAVIVGAVGVVAGIGVLALLLSRKGRR